MKTSLKTSESELIRRIRERAARQGPGAGGVLKLSIGDDCAILRPRRGQEIVVTTDMTLENTHFRHDWHPPESVGYRSLARGLSDIAAMGAHPEAAFLSIAVPAELAGRWLDRFLDGWMLAAKRYSVPLAGGDTAESPRPQGSGRSLFTADVVLLGSVPAGRALRRSGARAGDILYVTGELGGAAAQLRAISSRAISRRAISPRAISAKAAAGAAGDGPHLYPEPRLKAGAKLVASRLATAAIDLSDGLSTDLSHLCEASGLRAIVDREALPIARGATLEDALHGGEDYELLFTARPATVIPAMLGGTPVRQIGQMLGRAFAEGGSEPGPAIELRAADGRSTPLPPRGWEHFRSMPSKRQSGSGAKGQRGSSQKD